MQECYLSHNNSYSITLTTWHHRLFCRQYYEAPYSLLWEQINCIPKELCDINNDTADFLEWRTKLHHKTSHLTSSPLVRRWLYDEYVTLLILWCRWPSRVTTLAALQNYMTSSPFCLLSIYDDYVTVLTIWRRSLYRVTNLIAPQNEPCNVITTMTPLSMWHHHHYDAADSMTPVLQNMPAGEGLGPRVRDNNDGTICVEYEPKVEGRHEVLMTHNGDAVRGRRTRAMLNFLTSF